MSSRSSQILSLSAALLLGAGGLVHGQVVIGHDALGGSIVEFSTTPGGPCGAPVPSLTSCGGGLPPCPIPAPGPVPAGSLLGDVADDPLRDVLWMTDGFIIGEYTGDGPCGVGSCTITQTFPAPPGFGPILGMGADVSGTFTGGAPLLWITDGASLAAIIPPSGCATPTFFFPPCPAPTASGGPITDMSYDPSTGTLHAVEAGGFLLSFAAPTCTWSAAPIALTACGLGPGLTGIAFDTNTPVFSGGPPAGYVTDGTTVAYVDLATGLPAPPTFYSPVACTPAPVPFLSGLAMAQRGVQYGTSRFGASLTTFGQSSSPGPTFGLELTGAPAGDAAWLLLNFSFPGPGYFCPGVPGVGTTIWVDPTPPGSATNLGPLPSSCVPIPLPIPSGAPTGLNVFAQFVFLPSSGPPASDATSGLCFTLGAP